MISLPKAVCAIASLAFMVGIPWAALAQQHDPMGMSRAPATLQAGLGSLHHPIATTSEEAQKFFDQGLTLVYAFNFSEAVRSFRRAAELRPKMLAKEITKMRYMAMAIHDPSSTRENVTDLRPLTG